MRKGQRRRNGVLIEDFSRHFGDRWVTRRRMWAMGWPGKGCRSFSPKEIWQLLCFHYAAIGVREIAAEQRESLSDSTGYETIPDPYGLGPPSYRKLKPAANARPSGRTGKPVYVTVVPLGLGTRSVQ